MEKNFKPLPYNPEEYMKFTKTRILEKLPQNRTENEIRLLRRIEDNENYKLEQERKLVKFEKKEELKKIKIEVAREIIKLETELLTTRLQIENALKKDKEHLENQMNNGQISERTFWSKFQTAQKNAKILKEMIKNEIKIKIKEQRLRLLKE